jgi:hypothetical protein
MREFSQQAAGSAKPMAWRSRWTFRGGVRLLTLTLGMALPCVPSAFAQTLRLGSFDLTMVGRMDVAWDSNVDDLGVDEVKEGYQRSDFYLMPGLSVVSSPVGVWPSTLLGLSAGIAYQDYLVRNDLDTAIYDAGITFNTSMPRLSLDGQARVEYSVEGMEDTYVPGGSKRDPMLTQAANVLAGWNHRNLRLEAGSSFTRERHDYEEFWIGDQDETIYSAGAYLQDWRRLSLFWTWVRTETILVEVPSVTDETVYTFGANWALFKWGGPFYTWERTLTTIVASQDSETDVIEQTFGFSGAIPVDILPRPKVTYSFGMQYEETRNTDAEDEKTWEPVHTISVSDELQLSRTIDLRGNATWSSDVDADEIEFQYNVVLTQLLGPRAEHALSFSQEPRRTFGSNTDTETTTYGYTLGIKDLFIYNLGFNFGMTREENTPLEEGNSQTEVIHSINAGLIHTRQITSRLQRQLSYQYTWEDSNLEATDPIIKHLVIYGLIYQF